jgi:uncharacterized protein YqhQ
MSTPVGGQAVLDGVMMRCGDRWALAQRVGGGGIQVTVDATPRWAQRVQNVPLVRGLAALSETLVLGFRSTIRSSRTRRGERHDGISPGEAVSVVTGVALAVGLFGLLPAVVADRSGTSGAEFHGIEATLRIGLLAGYLWIIGRNPQIARVWGYHGAEHKTVNTHEAGDPLDLPTVRSHSTRHLRCGTTFLLLVAVVAIGVHVVVGDRSLPVLLVSRVVGLPVIAAIAYEVIRVAGRPDAPAWMRPVLLPGLGLQALTTREPDDDQLEVAIAALRAVTEPADAPAPLLRDAGLHRGAAVVGA